MVAAWFYLDSLRPSLLPRGAIVQAFVSSVWILLGYVLGLVLSWLISRRYRIQVSLVVKRMVVWVAFILGFLMTLIAADWQRQQIDQLRLPDQPYQPVVTYLLVVLATLFLVLVGSGIHRLILFFTNHLHRWITRWMSYIGSVVLVLAMLYIALSYGVLKIQQNLERSQRAYDPAMTKPTSMLRSGGPGSLVSWEGLGKKGREFAGTTSGNYQVEPIRVYAGIDNESDLERRAQLVVDELQRTGAFTRHAIVLYTPSGTGWVSEAAVAPVEEYFDGNVASAALQYSAVSSFLQFVIDQDIAGQASNAMFDKVREKLNELPQAMRPRLYLYGESLGSLGSQMQFVGVEPTYYPDYFDGALWVGSPSISQIWQSYYLKQNGLETDQAVIPFIDTQQLGDYELNGSAIFIYNNTDPVVRIHQQLLYKEPDWLGSERPPEISPHMRWRPGLTFLQLIAELLKSSSQPSGTGHNYYEHLDTAWHLILEYHPYPGEN